jgi:hypothetical protein
VFPLLKAVRPLGFAAVAVAAAVTVAGCKPSSFSTSSGSGSGLGTTASSSSVAQVLTAAAQQAQTVNTFTASVQITASGATSANLFGTMNEVATTPTSPTISLVANAGQLGRVKIILSNGNAFIRSPLFLRTYHKRWIESSMSTMSSSSGLNLGPLLALLEGSSPLVQTQMFPFGSNMRFMGRSRFDGLRMREFGGHLVLANILSKLSSSMQPMAQSWMNSGITLTRFRVFLDPQNMVRKLELIAVAGNTTFTVTLNITSFNQPMHIAMPSTTVIFILPGTGAVTATPTPTMAATPTTQPSAAMTPAPASTVPATPAASEAPTHW